ncbi:hypothetical protein [Paraburkholderia fungorum]|uniref:Uncharacterized protein n=1 Tax=Paraburkholderia fungorum TaxID=134537 RepID=A0A3R7GMY6_9BURK|nr:hypothetical protein [Paraburkholderia fungorum]RKF33380.1 hypothetical protein BCY88_09975 [Paraburkholderia fungorum]
MFPAGIGGDDRRFMLRDLVCGVCNTTVFSPLERQFMRSSPAAFARIFLQAQGRGKGKKASIPTIDTLSTTIALPEHGEVEAELLAGGQAVTLMQIVLRGGGEAVVTGDDRGDFGNFIDAAREIIDDLIPVVAKELGSNGRAIYKLTNFKWVNDGYHPEADEILDVPPEKCLWRESFPSISIENRPARHPTLYQRTAGQIALRLSATDNIAPLLADLRYAIAKLSETPLPPYQALEKPSLSISMTIDPKIYVRVLAKIGLNLVAWTFGEKYIRDRAFKRTKAGILTGKKDILLISADENDALRPIFSGVPSNRHAMTLFPVQIGDKFNLALIIRLYGGATHAVDLGIDVPAPPPAAKVYFFVDYSAHQIDQIDSIEFMMKYPPKLQSNTI